MKNPVLCFVKNLETLNSFKTALREKRFDGEHFRLISNPERSSLYLQNFEIHMVYLSDRFRWLLSKSIHWHIHAGNSSFRHVIRNHCHKFYSQIAVENYLKVKRTVQVTYKIYYHVLVSCFVNHSRFGFHPQSMFKIKLQHLILWGDRTDHHSYLKHWMKYLHIWGLQAELF